IVEMSRGITRVRGYFPARGLGLGSDDESSVFMFGWTGWWKRDAWTSDDLAVDYAAAMRDLRVPMLALASQGDVLLCPPLGATRFAQFAPKSRVTIEIVRQGDDGDAPPDHMQLVTTRKAASSWQLVATFCIGQ